MVVTRGNPTDCKRTSCCWVYMPSDPWPFPCLLTGLVDCLWPADPNPGRSPVITALPDPNKQYGGYSKGWRLTQSTLPKQPTAKSQWLAVRAFEPLGAQMQFSSGCFTPMAAAKPGQDTKRKPPALPK